MSTKIVNIWPRDTKPITNIVAKNVEMFDKRSLQIARINVCEIDKNIVQKRKYVCAGHYSFARFSRR